MMLEQYLKKSRGEQIRSYSSIPITLSHSQSLAIMCPLDSGGRPIINKDSVFYVYYREENDEQSKLIFLGNHKVVRYRGLVKFAHIDETIFGLSLSERTQLQQMAEEMHFNFNRS